MNQYDDGGERTARAELTWIAEPGDRFLGALVGATSAARAMTIIRAGLPECAGVAVTADVRRAVRRWHARLGNVPPRGEVEQAVGRFRLVCPGDAEWPGGLDMLGDAAPVALWVTGAADLALACRRSVAVTGARAATAYGSYLAAEFGAGLGERGWTVISGASFGVDAAAHNGCLAAGGTTIAVTAGGLDQPYPAGHAGLLDVIAGCGAVASEAPPGTVIVEAGTRGGAITTARCARELGRTVMAVPGPVTSELSAGCHQLIQSGHAVLVTSVSDIAGALGAAVPGAGG